LVDLNGVFLARRAGRHGGTPEAGIAKVLLNVRDDAPELVLATPPGPGLTTGLDPVEADREAFACAVLGACIGAYRKELPGQENSTVLIHLEAAALDRGDVEATASGIARVLREENRGPDTMNVSGPRSEQATNQGFDCRRSPS